MAKASCSIAGTAAAHHWPDSDSVGACRSRQRHHFRPGHAGQAEGEKTSALLRNMTCTMCEISLLGDGGERSRAVVTDCSSGARGAGIVSIPKARHNARSLTMYRNRRHEIEPLNATRTPEQLHSPLATHGHLFPDFARNPQLFRPVLPTREASQQVTRSAQDDRRLLERFSQVGVHEHCKQRERILVE